MFILHSSFENSYFECTWTENAQSTWCRLSTSNLYNEQPRTSNFILVKYIIHIYPIILMRTDKDDKSRLFYILRVLITLTMHRICEHYGCGQQGSFRSGAFIVGRAAILGTATLLAS